MSKAVLMATFGSLGDVHPYIAIGRELAARGHRPAIATTDRYRGLVESNGIAFHAVQPGEAQLGDAKALVEKAFHPLTGTRFLVDHVVMRWLVESYQDIDRAAAHADFIVTHPLAMTAILVAEKRGLPWASSVLAPLSLLSTLDPPLFPGAGWVRSVRALGHGPYRMLFAAIKASCRRWERPLERFRSELGLAPRGQALFEGQYSPRLNLALFSPLLAAPAADWPPNTAVTGFARFDGPPPQAGERDRLEAFLAAGAPPIAFALGSSAVMIAGGFWDIAVAAARRLGRRAILLTGTAPASYGADVAAFDYLPYSLVFPHAAAVVHHAGMGTLSQALASGRPHVMVPLSFDQPDNAERAARLGGAAVLPFRSVDEPRLVAALRAVLGTTPRVADQVRREDGASAAADALGMPRSVS